MRKIGYSILGIIFIVGIINSLNYIVDIAKTIEAQFSDSAKLKQLEQEYDYSANRAYALGRMWGAIGAEAYDSDEGIPKTKDAAKESAYHYLVNRVADSYMFGPDDFGVLPTNEEIINYYSVDFGSKNMPLNSFESGFVDAFIEYFRY